MGVALGKAWVKRKLAQLAADAVLVPPGGFRTVVFGDSITALANTFDAVSKIRWALGWFYWLNAYLGGPFKIVNNAGVSGNTTGQMWARIQTDVFAFAPQYVLFLGGRNDINGGATYAATVANLKLIFDAIIASGAQLRVGTIFPDQQISLSAAKQAVLEQVNYWIREYARTHQNCRCYDFFSAFVDPTSATGAQRAGLTSDGTHPNATGGQLLGLVAYNVEKAVIPWIRKPQQLGTRASATITYGNAIQTPTMEGSGGGNSGANVVDDGNGVPNGWTHNLYSGTVAASTFSRVARTDMDVANIHHAGRVVSSYTATPSQSGLYQLFHLSDVNFAPGDTVRGSVRLNLTAANTINQLRLSVFMLDAGFGTVYEATTMQNFGDTLAVFPGPAEFETEDFTIPATSVWVAFQIRMGGNNGSTGTLEVSSPDLRRVLP